MKISGALQAQQNGACLMKPVDSRCAHSSGKLPPYRLDNAPYWVLSPRYSSSLWLLHQRNIQRKYSAPADRCHACTARSVPAGWQAPAGHCLAAQQLPSAAPAFRSASAQLLGLRLLSWLQPALALPRRPQQPASAQNWVAALQSISLVGQYTVFVNAMPAC